jgi:hypothetical protein
MLTIGGMIGTPDDKAKLANVLNHEFVSQDRVPIQIAVPPLTYREKQWLDSNLNVARLRFELDDEFLENYRRFYKQYPTFVESIT